MKKFSILTALLVLFSVSLFADDKVLTICSYNEVIEDIFNEYYSEKLPSDVTVNFIILPSPEYNSTLEDLLNYGRGESQIDLFVLEPDNSDQYLNSKLTLDLIGDLGMNPALFENQFNFSKNLTTSQGRLKGSMLVIAPTVICYRRSIAKKTFGDDSPEFIDSLLSDWDKVTETARVLKKKGVYMFAGVEEMLKIFDDKRTTPWRTKGTLNIDQSSLDWVELSKKFYMEGLTYKADSWSMEWMNGYTGETPVFAYIAPDWLIYYIIGSSSYMNTTTANDWAVCKGPDNTNWGGFMLCASSRTDNADLVADIIATLTCDKDTMTKIALDQTSCVNNRESMYDLGRKKNLPAIITDTLHGQNPYAWFAAAADNCDSRFTSDEDYQLRQEFYNYMVPYFTGNYTLQEQLNCFQSK